MFRELLIKLARELKSKGISYMVTGGQAVLYYGEPRLTKDIDLTVGVNTDEFERIRKIAAGLSFTILPEKAEEFVKETMVLPLEDTNSGIRIDITFSFSAYETEAIQRAVPVVFDNQEVMFISLEDLIIHKLIAGRPRDIEDIKTVMQKNPEYNHTYISKKLRQFDAALTQDLTSQYTSIISELQ